jgi:hypothetical protein
MRVEKDSDGLLIADEEEVWRFNFDTAFWYHGSCEKSVNGTWVSCSRGLTGLYCDLCDKRVSPEIQQLAQLQRIGR